MLAHIHLAEMILRTTGAFRVLLILAFFRFAKKDTAGVECDTFAMSFSYKIYRKMRKLFGVFVGNGGSAKSVGLDMGIKVVGASNG